MRTIFHGSSVAAWSIAALAACTMLACGHSTSSTHNASQLPSDAPKPNAPQPEQPTHPLAPSTVRIVGTVMSVDSLYPPRDNQSPPYMPPSHLVLGVRVDSIGGYGMAFLTPLSLGQIIAIRTGMVPPLPPGMPVDPMMPRPLGYGSRFQGDVLSHQEHDKPVYEMFEYTVR